MRLGQIDLFDAQAMSATAGRSGQTHWVSLDDGDGETVVTLYFSGRTAEYRAKTIAKAINDAQALANAMVTATGAPVDE